MTRTASAEVLADDFENWQPDRIIYVSDDPRSPPKFGSPSRWWLHFDGDRFQPAVTV